MGGRWQGWRRVIVLAMLVAVGCSSSGTSTSSSSPGSSEASPAPRQGLTLQLAGDLSGATDPSSTRVSQCSAVNGLLHVEGTVSLGGAELSVTLTYGGAAALEITDLAAGRTWSAPAAADPTATVSVQASTPTSGSITAIASSPSATHLEVRGTYGC
ncbi:MAG: hypothetical protein QOI95_1871 [Acidimicrobiaceae bacterium]|jgi:hypothetical protein